MKSVINLLVLLSLAGASCKKDPVQQPPASSPVLSVKLNPAFLGAMQADSAIATWKQGAAEQIVRLQLRNDSLVAPLALFAEGMGELWIQIFSNKKLGNQYFTEWVFKKTVAIEKTKTIIYAGPQTFFDAGWLPRVLLKDGIGHAALLGLRPDDPYFLVKDLQQNVVSLSVEKAYWQTKGGVQQVGGGIFTCKGGCLNGSGNVENVQFFNFLPNQIGTRNWNHISLTVLYETDPNGGGWLLTLEYEP